jgi:hypothetical protein
MSHTLFDSLGQSTCAPCPTEKCEDGLYVMVASILMTCLWLGSEFLGWKNRRNGGSKSLLEALGRRLRVVHEDDPPEPTTPTTTTT